MYLVTHLMNIENKLKKINYTLSSQIEDLDDGSKLFLWENRKYC